MELILLLSIIYFVNILIVLNFDYDEPYVTTKIPAEYIFILTYVLSELNF